MVYVHIFMLNGSKRKKVNKSFAFIWRLCYFLLLMEEKRREILKMNSFQFEMEMRDEKGYK